MDESIPLCAYFLIQISQHLPIALKSQYVKKATLVCQLYELYNVVAFADKLGNVGECAQVLISLGEDNDEASLFDIIEVGSLFSLSKEDVVIQLIVYYVQNDVVGRVENIFA
jgi:hypothetical protein